MTELQNITNTEFLQAIFGVDYVTTHVCCFTHDPNAIPPGNFAWAGAPYNAGNLPRGQNQYFTISQFHLHESGRAYRRKALFKYCGVIVLDDVFEKIPEELALLLPEPSYKLETSPGSEQWGYILERPPFQDHSRDLIDNLLDGLVAQGLCPGGKDPGMRGVTRYVRLPEGSNLKARNCTFSDSGVKCHLLSWNPDLKVTVEQLATPFDIDLHRVRAQPSTAAGYDGDDHPAFVVLNDAGLIKTVEGGGVLDITCPMVHQHTGAVDNGCEVKLFEDGNANIHCYHGHGEELRVGFRAWLRQQPLYATARQDFIRKREDVDAAFASFAAAATVHGDPPTGIAGPLVAVMPDEVSTAILNKLSAYFDSPADAQACYYPGPLQNAWPQIFYSGTKTRGFMFNNHGDLIQGIDGKIPEYIEEVYGPFLDQAMVFARQTELELTDAKVAKLISGCFRVFMRKIEVKHQRDTISYRVDMFCDRAHMEIAQDTVNVTYPFTPLKCRNVSQCTQFEVDAVVNDYREHFPQFDRFLELLCAARFAPTAREGYLWLNVMSDWGKTFLINGVLGSELGIIVEASMAEIELVFKGTPIGKTAQDFIRSWALFVDEAQIIRGEIKQLDSHISGSPKHQLSFSAQVYTKIFASASSIASFAGESGIEQQFDNRFSYLAPEGGKKLNTRPLFAASKFKYREALALHVAGVLNGYVAGMRELGPERAADVADAELHVIHEDWRISKTKGSLEESHVDFADELKTLILRIVNNDPNAMFGLTRDTKELFNVQAGNLVMGHHAKLGRVVVLKKPAKIVKEWLKDQVDRSESGKLLYSHDELLAILNEAPQDCRLHRLNGAEKVVKGILIRY